MAQLTHLDESGAARMVDVGQKSITERVAVAGGRIVMLPETLRLLDSGSHKKGDVLRMVILITRNDVEYHSPELLLHRRHWHRRYQGRLPATGN